MSEKSGSLWPPKPPVAPVANCRPVAPCGPTHGQPWPSTVTCGTPKHLAIPHGAPKSPESPEAPSNPPQPTMFSCGLMRIFVAPCGSSWLPAAPCSLYQPARGYLWSSGANHCHCWSPSLYTAPKCPQWPTKVARDPLRFPNAPTVSCGPPRLFAVP
jgi:hypothetical protein